MGGLETRKIGVAGIRRVSEVEHRGPTMGSQTSRGKYRGADSAAGAGEEMGRVQTGYEKGRAKNADSEWVLVSGLLRPTYHIRKYRLHGAEHPIVRK